MSKVCIKCGTMLEDGAVFCDECGTKQIEEVTENKKVKEKKPKEKKVKEKVKDDSQPKNSGMSIASLVFGLIAICTFGVLYIPEILGIVFGIVGILDKDRKHNLAIAGLVLSILSIVIMIVLVAIALILG